LEQSLDTTDFTVFTVQGFSIFHALLTPAKAFRMTSLKVTSREK